MQRNGVFKETQTPLADAGDDGFNVLVNEVGPEDIIALAWVRPTEDLMLSLKIAEFLEEFPKSV